MVGASFCSSLTNNKEFLHVYWTFLSSLPGVACTSGILFHSDQDIFNLCLTHVPYISVYCLSFGFAFSDFFLLFVSTGHLVYLERGNFYWSIVDLQC